MPSFDVSPRIQTVLRYTYASSAGVNVLFYGQKLKWQTGLEYDSMRDDASDGGEYKGWGLSTGLRLYW